jgi:predicted acyltransferase
MLQGVCPIIKNIWTSTFALFSGGFCVALLGLLMPMSQVAPLSLRGGGQAWFEQFADPNAASLLFGLCGLAFILAILLVCHRKRWILKH